jgi:hypothetical protein
MVDSTKPIAMKKQNAGFQGKMMLLFNKGFNKDSNTHI